MDEFLGERRQRNEKLTASTKASGDAKLDEETYKKTMAEVERGVLRGPYNALNEMPFDDVALILRHGIWEHNGGWVKLGVLNQAFL